MPERRNQVQHPRVPRTENSWQQGLPMYQIYPQSFKDTNGDGWGDLNGVIEKIPYLKDLGIGSVWLNPIFPSPLKDMGYDPSDYQAIHPIYGDFQTGRRMIDEFHRADMRVAFDLVLNHTSSEHIWFKESSSSRKNAKSDWYIWRDPKPDGSPPNNWIGNFGGGAWTYEPRRNQYYLHTFLPDQPDLNFENEDVLIAMGDNVRFWFNRGIDCMRLDSLPFVRKAKGLPNDEINPDYKRGDHPNTRTSRTNMQFQPEMFDVLNYFCDIAEEYTDKLIISEAWDDKWWKELYTATKPGIHAPFNSAPIGFPWTAKSHSEFFTEFYDFLRPGDIAVNTFDSHDVYKRKATLLEEDRARIVAMLNHTLPGIPVNYYQSEIGGKSGNVSSKSGTNPFNRFDDETKRTKDGSRLPMPWTGGPNAGFTDEGVQPWLPIPKDYETRNVQEQLEDPHSILNLHKALIAHRRNSQALRTGDYFPIGTGNRDVYGHQVQMEREKQIVLLNFAGSRQRVYLDILGAKVELRTDLSQKKDERINLLGYEMKPNEGIIISVST